MKLMPGVPELCAFLDERRIPRGLITRNVKASVDFFHANHLVHLHALSGTEEVLQMRHQIQENCSSLMAMLHPCRTESES